MQRWKANSDIGSFVGIRAGAGRGNFTTPPPARRRDRGGLRSLSDPVSGTISAVSARGLAMPDPDFTAGWAAAGGPPPGPAADTLDDSTPLPAQAGRPGVPG